MGCLVFMEGQWGQFCAVFVLIAFSMLVVESLLLVVSLVGRMLGDGLNTGANNTILVSCMCGRDLCPGVIFCCLSRHISRQLSQITNWLGIEQVFPYGMSASQAVS